MSTTAITPNLMSAVNPAAMAAKTAATEIQDKFMTLLVAQMKNQDPMNPLDNAQVTSQMAQLSTVTGIDKVNATLQALQGSFQSNQSLQATSMIGRGVLVPGSTLSLDAGKGFLGIDLAEPADSVKVTIKDASGNAVHTIDLGGNNAGLMPLQWDGTTDSGKVAPDGKYTFEVAATRAGSNIAGVSSLAFGQVASVSTGSQGVKLNVAGIGNVNLSDIKQIL
jgi:flagellar basal-body rod modification protein FlgD